MIPLPELLVFSDTIVSSAIERHTGVLSPHSVAMHTHCGCWKNVCKDDLYWNDMQTIEQAVCEYGL